MKTEIDRHASVILVYCDKEVFTNQYDETYPLEAYRNRINLLGGTPQRSDNSPLETLNRELNEEFSLGSDEEKEFDPSLTRTLGSGPPAPKVAKFASIIDIDLVRKSILANLRPYKDFVITVPPYGQRPSYNVLFHSYVAELSSNVFDKIRRNQTEGKSLVCEGFTRVTRLDEVSSGQIGTAWATQAVFQDFFNIKLPNPDKIQAVARSVPRESYAAYNRDFIIKKK